MAIIHRQAINPQTKAAKKPNRSAARDIASVVSDGDGFPELSRTFLSVAPNINGSTIRKENRAAVVRSIFKITAVAIVLPERESPGRMAAIICDSPINKDFTVES